MRPAFAFEHLEHGHLCRINRVAIDIMQMRGRNTAGFRRRRLFCGQGFSISSMFTDSKAALITLALS